MKKALFGLALVASSLLAELKWASSYDKALVQAAKEKKDLMVMLSQEECPSCDYMKSVVFEEKVIEDTIHKNFVPVHIDIHTDKIPSGLGFMGTPTFYFLDATGKKLKRHDGRANIPTFLGILNSVKK